MRIVIGVYGTLTCLSLAGVAACGSSVEAEEELVLGLIDPSLGAGPPLVVPEFARTGESVPITVATFGSGSCTRPGEVESVVQGLIADITVYDWMPADPDAVCTRDLERFPRELTVRFDSTGDATIRLHGRGRALSPEHGRGPDMTLEDQIRIER